MATVAFAFDTVWYYSYCQCQSDFKKKSNLVLVSIEALEHVVCKKVGFEKHFKDKHGCKPCWKMVI